LSDLPENERSKRQEKKKVEKKMKFLLLFSLLKNLVLCSIHIKPEFYFPEQDHENLWDYANGK
jgi:hypothetical protein